ncbi:hypothetical protein [Devosia sp. RR2S18]|uniref:hypothetical protein n=1 Tax=Devosia rhizosphaerae TaxID=3049774 RepID=UPI0025426131|nr:hypothetical protein [Devosia sp. RR2S18]WIJ25006.1 hypothetical protein QOV41_18660 [Devosia sp. RR2S18]
MEESYAEAVQEILKKSYGEELLAVAPDPTDRPKAIAWFQRQGLGEGSARNKAATYMMIASPSPGEAGARSSNAAAAKPKAQKSRESKAPPKDTAPRENTGSDGPDQTPVSLFPVNLNLQIHISADVSSDQIDAIFASMKRHLGNAKLT